MDELVHRPVRELPAGPTVREFQIASPPQVEVLPPLQAAQFLLPLLGSTSVLLYAAISNSRRLLIVGVFAATLSVITPLVQRYVAQRNLDRRVEALVPVSDPSLAARLDEIFDVLMQDDMLSWTLGPDGSWSKVPGDRGIDAQQRLQELAVERAGSREA